MTDDGPLGGRTVVVTRPRERAAALADRLEAAGAKVLIAPVIRTGRPEERGPLDLAVERLDQYQWIVFTSPKGVEVFVERLFERGRDVRAVGDARLAAIGSKTADRLRARGLRVDLVPETYRAEALAGALVERGVTGKTILVPRSAIARPVLVDELRTAGALVDEVDSYTIEREEGLPEELVEGLVAGRIDAVTFTASSTVRAFVALAGEAGVLDEARRCVAACIGPITASTARENGLDPAVVADPYTIASLAEAVVEHFAHG